MSHVPAFFPGRQTCKTSTLLGKQGTWQPSCFDDVTRQPLEFRRFVFGLGGGKGGGSLTVFFCHDFFHVFFSGSKRNTHPTLDFG